MASSSNKPTAVHFSLVAFVMISAVCGFMWYMSQKDLALARHDLDNAKKETATNKTVATKAVSEVDLLKKYIGHMFQLTGTEGTDDANMTSMVGNMKSDFSKYAPEARADYTSALQKLAEELRNAKQERDDLRTKWEITQKNYVALESRENTKLGEQTKAVARAEAELKDQITKKEEILAAKNQEVAELQNTVKEREKTLDDERTLHAKDSKDFRQVIDNQTVRLTVLTDELEKVKKTSFEVPKGLVRFVDYTNRSVWINLGEDDRLRVRTTFSVYEKSNQGMARGPEDIKGAIEVTRILGPHMAEAKITKDDIYRPFAAGDPIYTPLWSPAGSEKFAMVGIIDIDNDKHSDRDAIYQKIALSGAEVAAEVNEKGVRTGVMDQNIKFLVLGRIPKLDEADTPEQREQFNKMFKEFDVIKREAQQNGVRIITLNDFANYIGYVSQSRLFRPGDKPVDQLNEGAHSTGTNKAIGHRRSPGKVSDLFEKDKTKYKPPVSPGTTSKLFKGGR